MNTQTRETLFGIEVLTEIKEKLTLLRPQNSLNEWDVLHESEHKKYCNPSEEIVIHFSSNNSNRYRISSSFILEKDKRFTFKDAKNLINNPEKEFVKLCNFIEDISDLKFEKKLIIKTSCLCHEMDLYCK